MGVEERSDEGVLGVGVGVGVGLEAELGTEDAG